MGCNAAKPTSQLPSTPRRLSDGKRAASMSPESQGRKIGGAEPDRLAGKDDLPSRKKAKSEVYTPAFPVPEYTLAYTPETPAYSKCKLKIEGILAPLSDDSSQRDGRFREEIGTFRAVRTIDGIKRVAPVDLCSPELDADEYKALKASIPKPSMENLREGSFVTIKGTGKRGRITNMLSSKACFVQLEDEEADPETEKTRRVLLECKALKAMIPEKGIGGIKVGSFVSVRGTEKRGIVTTILSSGICFVQVEDDGVSMRVHAEHLCSLDRPKQKGRALA